MESNRFNGMGNVTASFSCSATLLKTREKVECATQEFPLAMETQDNIMRCNDLETFETDRLQITLQDHDSIMFQLLTSMINYQ